MRKLLKATGVGLKHFFGARETRDNFMEAGHRLRGNGTKLQKAEVLAMLGMFTVYKGTPMALGKNIADSIKVGKWAYGDIHQQEHSLDEALGQTGISEEGKRAIKKIIQTGGSASSAVDLTPADAAAFRQFEADLNVAAGNCVNF